MLKKILKPTNTKRVLFFLLGDIGISIFTIYISFLLRFNFHIPEIYYYSLYKTVSIVIPLKIIAFYYYHLYQMVWRYFGFTEYKKLIYAHIVTYGSFIIIFILLYRYFSPFPRSVIVIDMFLSLVFIGFFRALKRFLLEKHTKHIDKAAIFGTNDNTSTIIKSTLDGSIEYDIKVIMDDHYAGNYFSDIPVCSYKQLKDFIQRYHIQTILITKELSQKELNEYIDKFYKLGIKKIKQVKFFSEDATPSLKDISIEDLLARHPKDLDKEKISSFLKNKTVLVTGAGGSIGSEICRQCEKYGVKELIMLDHSEYNLYMIEQEIKNITTKAVMQSVTNKEYLDKTFQKYKPDIVIHAAAYKHVPLVEENIQEGILNNVLGTKNVIDTSIKNGVKKFVLISTDKAVRPTNVMGATKRICELYAQNVISNSTEIVAVRFGNVLGSSGSVIPKFKAQIEKGGPVTVTHPDITRYFMLISEACKLVLQAAAIGKGGEIFILDMGEPVKIVDLAKKMCELSGKNNIEIKFTGLRPGEKLYEELLIDDTNCNTEYDSITIAKSTNYNIDTLKNDIEELLSCKDKLSKLKQIVPEFNHQNNTK